jgi:hypothetical protein
MYRTRHGYDQQQDENHRPEEQSGNGSDVMLIVRPAIDEIAGWLFTIKVFHFLLVIRFQDLKCLSEFYVLIIQIVLSIT